MDRRWRLPSDNDSLVLCRRFALEIEISATILDMLFLTLYVDGIVFLDDIEFV